MATTTIPGLVSPDDVRATRRAKLLLYGGPGVGKTTLALKFPKPVYSDPEKGAIHDDYLDLLKASGGAYTHQGDLDGLIDLVRRLLPGGHEFLTLVIDTLTPLWVKECDAAADHLKSKTNPMGTAHGANVGLARRKLRRLFDLLMQLDMNVVVILQAKDKWVGQQVDGITFDGDSKLVYWFDLVLRAEMSKAGQRMAYVEKSRIRTFPQHTSVPFDMTDFAKRCGGLNILAAPVKPVALAETQEVDRLLTLLTSVPMKPGQTPERVLETWLGAARVSSVYDLPRDKVAKCIEWCGRRLASIPDDTQS